MLFQGDCSRLVHLQIILELTLIFLHAILEHVTYVFLSFFNNLLLLSVSNFLLYLFFLPIEHPRCDGRTLLESFQRSFRPHSTTVSTIC